MIVSALLALAAIAALATGTPRQAALLFGERITEAARRGMRVAGVVLLALSCVAMLRNPDLSRSCVAWIGILAIEALGIALGMTVIATRTSGATRR